MPVYQTTFEISAPASRVWKLLTNLGEYGDWNPQITRASGTIAQGATISLRLTLPARPALDVSATHEDVQPDRLPTWRGHVLAPWFFEGYRTFAIEPITSERVSVTHVEDIHGLIAPAFRLLMGGPVHQSHRALNQALRARAEAAGEPRA
jgi:hypothetical protein